MRKLLLFIGLLFIAGCSVSSGTSVLMVGNSHTHYNDMPEMLANIAAHNGHDLDIDMSAPPGYWLDQHVVLDDTMKRIESGDYDFIVIQEQSVAPSVGQLYNQRTIPAMNQLTAAAREAGSEVVLYQTWGHKNGHDLAGYSEYLPMQDAIINSYNQMASANGARVARVGEAWRRLHLKNDSTDLYSPDGYHPSPTGSYLAAVVIGEALTGADFEKGPILEGVDEQRVGQLLEAS